MNAFQPGLLRGWSRRATFARSRIVIDWNDLRTTDGLGRLPFLASASPIILLARAWFLRDSPGFAGCP